MNESDWHVSAGTEPQRTGCTATDVELATQILGWLAGEFRGVMLARIPHDIAIKALASVINAANENKTPARAALLTPTPRGS